jgi:TM2 domain-containing membrane protein YozV
MGTGVDARAHLYFDTMGRSHWIILILFSMLALHGTAAGPFLDHERIWREEMVAMEIPANIDEDAPRENTRLVGSALAVFLGPFGAHRLYLGTNTKVAIIYGLTFGGFGLLPLLDLGHLLFTRDLTPYKGNTRVFMWSRTPTPP